MAVILGTVTLSEVLTWSEEETVEIPIKRVVRKSTNTIQSAYFTRTPRMISITARCTATIKSDLRTLKNQYLWQTLYDYDGTTLVDYVWIEKLEPDWRGDQDKNYPWYINITLICSST
jgi:hypothetical protein